jgi:PAS domain S-box-containing protein
MITTPKKSRPATNQASPGLYFVQTSLHGVINYANEPFSHLIGISCEELIDSFLPVYLENGRNAFHELHIEFLAGLTTPVEREIPILIDGKIIPARWFITPIQKINENEVALQWLGVEINQGYNGKPAYSTSYYRELHKDPSANAGLYRTFIQQSFEGIWRFEVEEPCSIHTAEDEIINYFLQYGYLAECNESFAKMYGFEGPAEIIGAKLSDFMPSYDPANLAYFRAFIRAGFYLSNAESQEKDRLGNTKIFINNLVGIVQDGKLQTIWGTQQDITEQRAAEKRIRLQASMIENLSDALASSDLNFNVTSWNKHAEELYGISSEEITGKRLIDVIDMRYHNTTRSEVVNTIFEKGYWNGEVSFFRKSDGVLKTVLSTIYLIYDEEQNPSGVVAVNKDITDRREAEEQLSIQANILANLSDAVTLSDLSFHIKGWNNAAEEIFGIKRNDILGKRLIDVVNISYGTCKRDDVIKAIFEQGKWSGEVTFTRGTDNSLRTLLIAASLHMDDQQKPAGIVVVNKDITDRKKAEHQVRESEERFRNMADTAPVMIWLTNENNQLSYINKYWSGFTGIKPSEAMHYDWSKVIHPDDRVKILENYHKDFIERKPVSQLYRLKSRNGDYRWVLDNAVPRFLDDGTFLGYIGSMVDIHDRKVAEEKIRFQAELIENVSDIIISTDTDFKIITWNRAAEKIYGLPSHDAVGKRTSELVTYEYVDTDQQKALEELQQQSAWKGKIIFRNTAGEPIYLQSTVSALTDEKGTFIGYVAVNRDITEQVKAEQFTRKSEAFYRSLIADSLDGIALADATGLISFVAPSVTNILGYEPEELINTNIFLLAHPDDAAMAKDAFLEEVEKDAQKQYIVIRVKHRNGEWLWCSVRGHNLMHNEYVQSMVIYFSDDTRRKKMEDDRMRVLHELRRKEQEFRDLSENAPTIIQRIDKQFRYTYCNRAYTTILGSPITDIIGKTVEEINKVSPDLQRFMKAAREVFSQKNIETLRLHIKRKDGTEWHFLTTIAPEINENGEVESILAISSNITDIRHAEAMLLSKEEELLQSNQRFELATKAATDTIWEINMDNGYIYVTPEFTQRFGYSLNDMTGKSGEWYLERIHPDDRLAVVSKLTQTFSKQEIFWRDEFRWRCKDGSYRYIYDQAYLFYDENGRPYKGIGAIQDITERKEAESQLIQKDILLAATAQAANELLREEDLEAGIGKSMRIIGRAAKVDRVYVFRYHPGEVPADNYYYPLHSWNVEEYETSAEAMNEEAYPEIFGRIKEGAPSQFFYKNAKRAELKTYLQEKNIRSSLLVPIFVQNAHWGFAGFDQCSYERSWTSMEMDILKAFASNLAGTLEREESKRRLLESEIKFKSLFQSSLDVVNVLDDQIKIKFVTPSVKSVLGYDELEVIGRHGYEFIHPEDTHEALKILDELVQRPDQHVIADLRIKNKDNEWIWMEGKAINKLNDPIINGVIVSFRDISDRKRSEQQLQGYSEHITNILSSITDGFIALDFNFNVLWWNAIAAQLTGVKDMDVLGKNIWETLPALRKTNALSEYKKAIADKSVVNFEIYIAELKVYFDINAYPSQQGLFVYFKDITSRKKQEMLLELERKVLELNANPTVSLQNTVDYFLNGIQDLNPGMLCSAQLLDESGSKVKHLSAPGLDDKYTAAINGLEIGPQAGSCGTAMYLRKIVIVEDIMTDPLWENYTKFVSTFRLSACWSFPIITSSNRILGSLAAYYRQKQSPTDEQVELLKRSATLLGIIIENKQAEQKINISNERYLLATKATNDAIWEYDIKNNRVYWGESFYTLFGYKSEELANKIGFWESKIHPDDCNRVVQLYDDAIKNKARGVIYAEYRFQKADGRYAIISDRAFMVYDDGEPSRFVGSMQDVTERKKLEKQLLKQEIDKQKIIAQAVVDAQEKERAEIGKDLHDNVNQILSTAKLYLELAKTDTSQRDALIKRSADSIFQAINEIRNISKALVPPSVKDLGLIDSIKDLVESVHMTKALQVKFVHEGNFENIISEKQKLMLFRIIQEQVNNVLKHAEAGKLVIELIMHEKLISLSITDNGKGFELEKVRFKKGVGLSNIESRANLFNGKVAITTAPGKGCKLFIQVPIHNH